MLCALELLFLFVFFKILFTSYALSRFALLFYLFKTLKNVIKTVVNICDF